MPFFQVFHKAPFGVFVVEGGNIGRNLIKSSHQIHILVLKENLVFKNFVSHAKVLWDNTRTRARLFPAVRFNVQITDYSWVLNSRLDG